MRQFSIILNTPALARRIPESVIICADGGVRFLHYPPDYLVGDMDSLVEMPESKNTIKLPTHKNETDGEFAVRYAIKVLGASHIGIFGVSGGRVDHVLGNLSLLALGHSLGAEMVGHDDGKDIYFTATSLKFDAYKNDTISIVPFGGDAVVSATGLEYPLESLLLPLLGTRGISNIAVSEHIAINVERGAILVFHYLPD